MQFRTVIRTLAWLILSLCLIASALIIALPSIAEYQIKKRLYRYTDPNAVDFKIRGIGFNHVLVSDIFINNTISVDRTEILYRLNDFPRIHIQKILVSGIEVRAQFNTDHKLIVPGLVLPKATRSDRQKPDTPFFAYLPEKIRIKNSSIRLSAFSQDMYLPFEVLATIHKANKTVDVQTHVYPFGEKVDVLAGYSMDKGLTSVMVQSEAFDLGHLNTFFRGKIQDVALAGPCDFLLQSNRPLESWSINISSVRVRSPIRTGIGKIDGTLALLESKLYLNGSFLLDTPVSTPLAFSYDLMFNRHSPYPYRLKLASTPAGRVGVTGKYGRLLTQSPVITAQMAANNKKGSGAIKIETGQGTAEYQSYTAAVSRLKAESSISFETGVNGIRVQADSRVHFFDINGKVLEGVVDIPSAAVSGTAAFHSGTGPSADLKLAIPDGWFDFPDQQVSGSGLQLYFPIQYPVVEHRKTGTCNLARISWNNRQTASVKGNITQLKTDTVQIDGTMDLDFLKKAAPEFVCSITMDKSLAATLDIAVNPFELTHHDIKRSAPQFDLNAELAVTVSARGHASLKNHRVDTRMHLDIRDGQMAMPDLKLSARGINTRIAFNDLLRPESVPGQIGTIDHIEMDKIKIENARVRFSIEDAAYLLVENLRFNWCNGIVSTESIRLPNEKGDYSLILYCDRLELTELLEQMGVFHAEGNGSLSGRIPVTYNKGNISFENGFLFSTPGSGGKVNITNTDKLIEGIPMDSPQFAQLDVAREALKNFEYRWVTLTLNTFEDTLFVNMEMDGKPSKVMPFVFQKDIGTFARVDASHPGSHFQGIKLDVNLNLPFNEVMKFGNKLKSLFNQ